MKNVTNRFAGFYENYVPPRTCGGREQFEEAREEYYREKLTRLEPRAGYCRRDFAGICLLAANVLAWVGVVVVIWRMR